MKFKCECLIQPDTQIFLLKKTFKIVYWQSGNMQTNVCDISGPWQYHTFGFVCIEDLFQAKNILYILGEPKLNYVCI